MRKIFWDNPYQRSLPTKIAAIDSNRILLEETIAFSFSGGQESETTAIAGFSDTEKQQRFWEIDTFYKVVF